jgi:REP element-mobilizing transposase RayT
MSRAYRHYPDGQYLYFLTSTVVSRLPLFLTQDYFSILADSFRYCCANKGLVIHAYVIMPNHFHMIASSQPRSALPGIIRDLKRYTSRELSSFIEEEEPNYRQHALQNAAMQTDRGNNYMVWQEGYHPVAIYSQSFFRQKLDYLHDNPVRKGFVRKPEDWRFSSAGEYLSGGTVGDVPIDRIELC